MLSLFFGHFEMWGLLEKIRFDIDNKIIYVASNATALDIRADLYSGIKRWAVSNPDNTGFDFPIRTVGGDPTITGQFAGDIYFMQNGWRVACDFAQTAITGVLFSDDFDTPYLTYDLVPQFGAQISSLVNGAVTTETVTAGTALTAEQTAQAVWQNLIESNLTAEDMMRIMTAMLAGKVSGAGTGTERFRDMDDTKDRVVVTVDEQGNRSAVVRDGA